MGAVGFGTGAWGDLIITSAAGVPVKTQPGAGVSVTAVFPFADIAGPGLSLFFCNVWPSDASGWVIVRGYYEIGLNVFALAQFPIFSSADAGEFRAGGRAGMGASVAGYAPSSLVFFMPSVYLAGFFSWIPSTLPEWTFTASVPLRWLLRADVVFSGSVGLELSFTFTPQPKREDDV